MRLVMDRKPASACRILSLAKLLLIGLFLSAVLGCGESDGNYPVRGTVTHQGQPVPHGTVMLNPTDTGMSSVTGRIGSDGTFEMRAAPGQYKVLVTVMTEADPDLEPDDPGYEPPRSLIPEQYSNPLDTPLETTVEEQENTLDLEL